jgi:hypothetical protein
MRKSIDDEEGLTAEQKEKLKAFHELYKDVIARWNKENRGDLPIYWVEQKGQWEWANRSQRRAMRQIRHQQQKALRRTTSV